MDSWGGRREGAGGGCLDAEWGGYNWGEEGGGRRGWGCLDAEWGIKREKRERGEHVTRRGTEGDRVESAFRRVGKKA